MTSRPKLRLLQMKANPYFMDGIEELYQTIERSSPEFSTSRSELGQGKLKSLLMRLLIRFPRLHRHRWPSHDDGSLNFAGMVSGDFRFFMRFGFQSVHNYIYMYDAWPRFHSWIFPLLDFFHINYVFFSSRQAWQAHQQYGSGARCKSLWIPEALNISEYHHKPPADREIDVLEFGRMYADYHAKIAPELQRKGYRHLFPQTGKALLFPDKKQFTQGLSNARIVICVPSSITHPERAEHLSTMTLRYLQAMASKCLIVGVCPDDMAVLFDYMPLVEIDPARPAAQLLEILERYEDYLPLIERNYLEVSQKHQWSNRWEIMKHKITETL